MKVITQPKVRVIGRSVFVENPDFLIPDDGTDAEKIGAYAAKRCYRSSGVNGRSNVENQTKVLENQHGSVLEHATVSLDISGITRACSLELNRHRQNAISQESTRYCDFENGDGAIVLEPYYAQLWGKHGHEYPAYHHAFGGIGLSNPEQWLLFDMVYQAHLGFDTYKRQVEGLIDLNPFQLAGTELRKWARGKARNILPHALETAGVWTGNYRAWRWFIELRSNAAAEDEVRRLAEHIYWAIRPLAPAYFDDFTSTTVRGIDELTPQYRKV